MSHLTITQSAIDIGVAFMWVVGMGVALGIAVLAVATAVNLAFVISRKLR